MFREPEEKQADETHAIKNPMRFDKQDSRLISLNFQKQREILALIRDQTNDFTEEQYTS